MNKILNLPSIKAVINEYKLFAKKSLGQNFLYDTNITDKIVRMAAVNKDDVIVEVGPGPGALTRSILLAEPNKLTIIEKDDRFVEILSKQMSDLIEIIHDDVFNIDFTKLAKDKKIKLLANLPYNIGSALLINFLNIHTIFKQITVMLQLEVVERIAAQPGYRNYGRLSVMFQNYFYTENLMVIPPHLFIPEPKVHSAILQLTPRVKPLYNGDIKQFSNLVQQLFANKRKQIGKLLKKLNVEAGEISLTGKERAEELPLEKIVEIANLYIK
jgi:16S rRNA (adenine1518-N6/adenine1519-N6)-dimethyltransferase